MQSARRWLLWKLIPNPDPAKKPKKVPHYCDGTPRTGTLDTPADLARLAPLEAAIQALEAAPDVYAGLGFALGPDGTECWQGVDLDRTDTRPELAALVDPLPGYVERSPSGTGVHAIGFGPAFGTLGSNATGIEAYCRGRFFTVTGDAIGGDLADLAPFVTGTLAPLHGGPAGAAQEAPSIQVEHVTPGTVADLRSALAHLRSDDRDLWIRIGLALKTLGDTGRGLWLVWSATSEKFDPKDAARTWQSFKPNATNYRAVFTEAQHRGWVNPLAEASERPRPGPDATGEGTKDLPQTPRVKGGLTEAEAESLVAWLWSTGRHAPEWREWPRMIVSGSYTAPWAQIAAEKGPDAFHKGVVDYLPARAALVERKNVERRAKGKPEEPDIPEEELIEHSTSWRERILALDVPDDVGRELLSRIPRPKGIGLITVGTLLDQPEPLKWLVRDHLPPVAVGMLFGASASGKSLVALHWAVSVATGTAWHGHRVTPGPVVYLAGEGHFGIRRRLKALAQHLGIEPALRAAPLAVSARGAALPDPASLEAATDEIDRFVEDAGPPSLIVVDTLHRNFGAGDENSAGDMGAFIAATDVLRDRYQVTVLIVHHSGHGDSARARGSSALRAAMDFEYGLEHDATSGIRTLVPTKCKDMPPPQPLSFDLEVVELPWLDDDGEPETSVVLKPRAETAAPKAKATPTLRLAFESLLCALDDHGIEPPDHWKHPTERPTRVVGLEGWRGAFYARHAGEPDAKKKAFQRARQALADGGAIGAWVDTYWPHGHGGTWPDLGAMYLAHGLTRGASNDAA